MYVQTQRKETKKTYYIILHYIIMPTYYSIFIIISYKKNQKPKPKKKKKHKTSTKLKQHKKSKQ